MRCTVRMWDTYLVSLTLCDDSIRGAVVDGAIGRGNRRILTISLIRLLRPTRQILRKAPRDGFPGMSSNPTQSNVRSLIKDRK